MLIASLPLESAGMDTTRRLVARRRSPVTAEENDFLEEMEGERTELGCTWKFEEGYRECDESTRQNGFTFSS